MTKAEIITLTEKIQDAVNVVLAEHYKTGRRVVPIILLADVETPPFDAVTLTGLTPELTAYILRQMADQMDAEPAVGWIERPFLEEPKQ